MEFSFLETPESGQETDTPPSYTAIYLAVGETNEWVVQNYALTATPQVMFRPGGVLFRKDIRRDPKGWGQYLITVPYGPRDPKTVPTGDFSFGFDTTGATVKIKCAKEHISTYGAAGLVAGDHHKGAIGVKSDGDCDGADIVVPALKLNYTFKHPDGIVDEAFARKLARATGRTNKFEYRGFQPDELLYIGSTGDQSTGSPSAVVYQFVASENVDDLRIGDILGIVKKGHDYAWVEFKDDEASGRAVRQPLYVHNERVYDSIDFNATFEWG